MTALIVPIGPAGSGKSTWGSQSIWRAKAPGVRTAVRRFTRTQILNLDTFRGYACDDEADQTSTPIAVATQHLLLAERMRRRLLTYVDATNLTHREGLLTAARDHNVLTVAIVFHVPADECVRRDEIRSAQKGIKPINPEKIHAMAAQMPRGFDPVPGFDITRHLDPEHGIVHGVVPPEHQDATWLA